jgi:hypothetical protein
VDDVAKVAAGLSKAQRKALARWDWSMLAQYEAGILEPLRFGLLTPDGLGHTLTPLGLAVRNHLKEQTDAR